MRVLRLPAIRPDALRFLRLSVPWVHSIIRSPTDECTCRGLELITRYLQPGFAKEMTGSPKFLGNLNDPFAMFQADAGRIACTRPYGAATWPLVCGQQRLPRQVFRRSIASLSDSLPTLRRGRYLPRRKTRFQLLVRLYWTGFSPARFR